MFRPDGWPCGCVSSNRVRSVYNERPAVGRDLRKPCSWGISTNVVVAMAELESRHGWNLWPGG